MIALRAAAATRPAAPREVPADVRSASTVLRELSSVIAVASSRSSSRMNAGTSIVCTSSRPSAAAITCAMSRSLIA